MDVVGRDPQTGQVVGSYQVGRQTKAGQAVARERYAMDDIEGAGEMRPTFRPYN